MQRRKKMILPYNTKTLPINLNTFDFVEREFVNGKKVKNKCGRDFLYYSLHYYFPDKFNRNQNNPPMIDQNKIFGFPVNALFAWTMIQFFKVPTLFEELELSLSINGRQIRTFRNFITSMINPNQKSAEEAIKEVEKLIDKHMELYRSGKCSIDKAAKEVGITVAEMMEEAAKNGIKSTETIEEYRRGLELLSYSGGHK